jgi:putative sterol carrier protein
MGEVTIQQLMNRLPGAFIPQNATGIDAVTFFDLSGAQGGQWTVTIRDEKIQVERGEPLDQPTLTLQADGQDVLDIFSGKLEPMRAFMMGKLRVKGNYSLAMKLTNLFHLDDQLFSSMQ